LGISPLLPESRDNLFANLLHWLSFGLELPCLQNYNFLKILVMEFHIISLNWVLVENVLQLV
jgi:hypothetical protein